jgi:hypothetical protein
MTAPADINHIPHGKPNLRHLPPEIAGRVEDSWRVGAIVSRYVYQQLKREYEEKARRESAVQLRQMVAVDPADLPRLMGDLTARSSSLYREYTPEELNAPVTVNQWIDTTHETCNRLSAEAEVLFFQMAIEKVPKEKKVSKDAPLLDCLRRVRNVVVHHKPVQLSRDEFTCRLTTPSDPSFEGIKVVQSEAWFLVVTPADLALSHGHSIAPCIADWFVRQCKRWPLSQLLRAATEEICKLYPPT